MTDLEQKLTGENKVLRDLLKSSVDVLIEIGLDGEIETEAVDMMLALILQIKAALLPHDTSGELAL